jgi:serine/threonine protein kinase
LKLILKLCIGFGHATEAQAFTLTEKCGTIGFIASEIAEGRPYGKPVDMWSLGVILYTLLGGCPPFQDNDDQKLLIKIKVSSTIIYFSMKLC